MSISLPAASPWSAPAPAIRACSPCAPGPRHPKQAFDVMVAAARKLAHELNGELKDEQRSVLTAQTIEHYRQRIIDHERRSLMQKR